MYIVCVCVKTTNTDVKTLRATEKAKDKEIDDLWRKLRFLFFSFHWWCDSCSYRSIEMTSQTMIHPRTRARAHTHTHILTEVIQLVIQLCV